MRAERVALLALLVGVGGCDGCAKKPPLPTAGSIAPLMTPSPTLPLPVQGFGDAVVSVPTGATRAMPVVVAVLGIGDTPEEQCEAWRDVVGTRAFVLCTRGAKHWVNDDDDAGAAASTEPPPPAKKNAPPGTIATDEEGTSGDVPSASAAASGLVAPSATPTVSASASAGPPLPKDAGSTIHQVGFFPVDVPTLDRELTASLAALKARFALYVDEKSLVYSGFSRGAFLGASIIARHPDKFGRAILIEGGQSAWSPEGASQFAQHGGKRVLFACGQQSCLDESEPIAQLLRGQKMDAKVVIGQGEGHGYKKQVKDELKKNFDWVVEGDPAWATK